MERSCFEPREASLGRYWDPFLPLRGRNQWTIKASQRDLRCRDTPSLPAVMDDRCREPRCQSLRDAALSGLVCACLPGHLRPHPGGLWSLHLLLRAWPAGGAQVAHAAPPGGP
ncbi:mCG20394, isoform CRA_a [Mus musculus]|nr:mCG20394, isoform CRA_a [Mus musculus]